MRGILATVALLTLRAEFLELLSLNSPIKNCRQSIEKGGNSKCHSGLLMSAGVCN